MKGCEAACRCPPGLRFANLCGAEIGEARSIGHFYRLRPSRLCQSARTASTHPPRSAAGSYPAGCACAKSCCGVPAGEHCAAPCSCWIRRDNLPQAAALRGLRASDGPSDTSPQPADGVTSFERGSAQCLALRPMANGQFRVRLRHLPALPCQLGAGATFRMRSFNCPSRCAMGIDGSLGGRSARAAISPPPPRRPCSTRPYLACERRLL